MPKNALASIQPWHPGLMYLLYFIITEEQMLEHRLDNQPIPAASVDRRALERDEETAEFHVPFCIYTKIENFGSPRHTVNLHKNHDTGFGFFDKDVQPPQKSPRYTPTPQG